MKRVRQPSLHESYENFYQTEKRREPESIAQSEIDRATRDGSTDEPTKECSC